jgi:cytochrome c553
VAAGSVSLSGDEIYADVCAQCHGPNGEGGIGPSLSNSEFQKENSDQAIFDIINKGHEATAMIAWGEILSPEQIEQLVSFIRQLRAEIPPEPSSTTPETPGRLDSSIQQYRPLQTRLPNFQKMCSLPRLARRLGCFEL